VEAQSEAAQGEIRMKQSKFRMTTQAALLASIAAANPLGAHAAPPAARVDFAIGNVAAVNKAGLSRPLAKGAQIEEGETVNTNSGRAQLRFTDGAYVSLQPQSEFRIDQYQYEGKQDGSEKTFLSLLKGGLRTITGFVGRSNKKNYQVSTTVATIGIRGTEYTIQYGGSISGTVGEGEIEVCSGVGCINVTNGESYYVANKDEKPQLSNKGTDLPPDPPPPPPSLIRTVEKCFDAQGANCEVAANAGQPLPPLTGTQTLDTAKIYFSGSVGRVVDLGATVVFDSQGNLLNVGGMPVSATLSGNDGIVAWGTFTDPQSPGVLTHFVAGVPVPSSDLANLGGSTGTYSLIGATPITDSQNNQIGTLNTATMTVAFGPSPTVGVDMAWTISGSPLTASLSGRGQGTSFSASGTCGASCSVSADILVFGPNAARGGMTYDIADLSVTRAPIQATGAAAFQQTSLVPTPVP
jgi:hypothetical protein